MYKNIKTYNQFINEGIRDKMTPVSHDKLKDLFDKITNPVIRLKKILSTDYPISEDELKEYVDKLSPIDKLMIAVNYDLVWVLKEAIKDGAELNNRNNEPLVVAIMNLSYNVLQEMFKLGVILDTKRVEPILINMIHAFDEPDDDNELIVLFSLLIDNGLDIHYKEECFLQASVEFYRIKFTEYLLKKGANPNVHNNICFRLTDEQKMKDLLNRYSVTNESLRSKMTPKSHEDIRNDMEHLSPNQKLMRGAREGIFWIIKDAMEEGADIHYSNDIALQLIIDEYGTNMEALKYLLKKGADVHAADDYALRFACEYGQLDVIELLLKYGANPHANSDYAIQIAQEDGRNDILDLFKNYGHINEGVRDKMTPKSKEDIEKTLKGYTPSQKLELGYKHQSWNLVKQAIENGANVHMNGDAALRQGCSDGNLDIVKYLLDNGADLHIYEDDCLLRACYSGNLELVKYLVDKGADIHAGQVEKVLRGACAEGHPHIVKYLLEKGADSRKITSSDVTFGENRRKIIELLNKYE